MLTEHNIPTMLSPQVRDFMREVGASWSGKGYAVECGAWLGGGTVAMAQGLTLAGYDMPLCVYDQWEATKQEVAKAIGYGLNLRVGQNIEPLFKTNVLPHCEFPLKTYRGKIERAQWCGHPIEIWMLDAAKQQGPFYGSLLAFGPAWIPGVTTVGLLDFSFYKSFGDNPKGELYLEQKAFIDRFSDRFELIKDFGDADSPAFFKYVKKIDWGKEL